MQTRVSTKGQIVLPGPLRRRLGICAGDPLDVSVEREGIEGERIVLTMRPKRTRPAKIIADPVTGLPMLSVGADAPVLSSKKVDEILWNSQDLFNNLEFLLFTLEKASKGKNRDEMRGSLHYATR